MAGEAERRRDRLTSVLVQCQSVREQAARLALLRARMAHDALQARREDAAETANQAMRQRSEGMRSRYQTLLDGPTGETGLRAVRDAGSRLLAECERTASALRVAETDADAAGVAMRDATRRLGAEVQRGRKRGRMAETAQGRLRAVLSSIEDDTMEDETGERVATLLVGA